MSALMLMDWGTTNFRAIYLDAQGRVLGRSESRDGVASLTRADMIEVASEAYRNCPVQDPQVFACGMVGSSVGWYNMPYLEAPAKLSDIADAIAAVPMGELTVNFIPGVKFRSATGWDVMRGEELQAFGWALTEGSGICIAPGTHSKWMRLRDGGIEGFFTSITGEMFALLRQYGLLRHHLTEEAQSSPDFLRGVDDGMSEQGLGRRLFSVRGDALLAELSNQSASDYVSGLLIGSEIAEGIRDTCPAAQPIGITGTPVLAGLYKSALAHLGYSARTVDAQAALRGAICQISSLRLEQQAL
ncbi:2-dehydro-3-deoxygalactonokinase [Microbulbifer sp. HZ11]|uniref:2-dehydro-3-deoxygalactonokinase n=1 Tax=Microbulbifer sp. HZ11 TaxID=1453501 RepID=UPI00068CB963|nr:2-dehydro-3-deoxygalactonokinase [Microbulbifer sp. HZ11]